MRPRTARPAQAAHAPAAPAWINQLALRGTLLWQLALLRFCSFVYSAQGVLRPLAEQVVQAPHPVCVVSGHKRQKGITNRGFAPVTKLLARGKDQLDLNGSGMKEVQRGSILLQLVRSCCSPIDPR